MISFIHITKPQNQYYIVFFSVHVLTSTSFLPHLRPRSRYLCLPRRRREWRTEGSSDGRNDGRTSGQTDKRTNGRTDRRTEANGWFMDGVGEKKGAAGSAFIQFAHF